jgi:hypothetical protein
MPETEQQNLLELTPRRNLQWEMRENNLVTLIIPKFKSEFLKKWFVPMLAKPNIKLKLDKYGSFVWNHCDGNTSIEKIGGEMAAQFGEPLDSMYERIGKFVAKLSRDKFLELKT